ncbi:MAG: transposase [Cyanobacteria bacterium P01_E01_bin.42]
MVNITAVKIYRKRWRIEAMFKDCKTGGYNLEECQAKSERLLTLILFIAFLSPLERISTCFDIVPLLPLLAILHTLDFRILYRFSSPLGIPRLKG